MIVWSGKESELIKNGIYGLYADNKLLYIGSTRETFKHRLQGHNSVLKKENHTNALYSYLKYNDDKKSLTMKPFVIFDYVRTNKAIDAEACGWMELGLISSFRPRFNQKGLKEIFIFPH